MSHPSFTTEDLVFLRAILDVPEDRNTWLVYADWLDDRSDPRAEFLRLMVARSLMTDDDPAHAEIESRLAHLRTELDPNWMMMFDSAPVAGCSWSRWPSSRCGLLWADMIATDVPDIRRCHQCRTAVVYCHTLEEAQLYASCGQQVALSSRIPENEVAQEPAFQPTPAPLDTDSDEFELTLDAPLDAAPPAPPPRARRPWWQFW